MVSSTQGEGRVIEVNEGQGHVISRTEGERVTTSKTVTEGETKVVREVEMQGTRRETTKRTEMKREQE